MTFFFMSRKDEIFFMQEQLNLRMNETCVVIKLRNMTTWRKELSLMLSVEINAKENREKKLATMKLIYSDRKLENEEGAESNWSAWLR